MIYCFFYCLKKKTLKNQKHRCYHCTKNEFFIKEFFSKFDQIRSFLQIWSHLLRKSLMENFVFCPLLCTDSSFPYFSDFASFFRRIKLRRCQFRGACVRLKFCVWKILRYFMRIVFRENC